MCAAAPPAPAAAHLHVERMHRSEQVSAPSCSNQQSSVRSAAQPSAAGDSPRAAQKHEDRTALLPAYPPVCSQRRNLSSLLLGSRDATQVRAQRRTRPVNASRGPPSSLACRPRVAMAARGGVVGICGNTAAPAWDQKQPAGSSTRAAAGNGSGARADGSAACSAVIGIRTTSQIYLEELGRRALPERTEQQADGAKSGPAARCAALKQFSGIPHCDGSAICPSESRSSPCGP